MIGYDFDGAGRLTGGDDPVAIDRSTHETRSEPVVSKGHVRRGLALHSTGTNVTTGNLNIVSIEA